MELYVEILSILCRAFVYLEGRIERPTFVEHGSHYVFRYENPSIQAAVIQKSARMISGLHASLLLLQGGFVQELGAIFRTLDEFEEDILFLCQAIRTGEISKLHHEYLKSFYQEEFDLHKNAFLSDQIRPIIPRKKIQAAIANMPENQLNPSDTKELHRTLSQAYSGYVHGASGHIMEMYGGTPPQYYLSGMLGTSRIAEFGENCWDYFYRGLIAISMVALSFGEEKLFQELYAFRNYFENQSGRTEWEQPEKAIKRIKKEKA